MTGVCAVGANPDSARDPTGTVTLILFETVTVGAKPVRVKDPVGGVTITPAAVEVAPGVKYLYALLIHFLPV